MPGYFFPSSFWYWFFLIYIFLYIFYNYYFTSTTTKIYLFILPKGFFSFTSTQFYFKLNNIWTIRESEWSFFLSARIYEAHWIWFFFRKTTFNFLLYLIWACNNHIIRLDNFDNDDKKMMMATIFFRLILSWGSKNIRIQSYCSPPFIFFYKIIILLWFLINKRVEIESRKKKFFLNEIMMMMSSTINKKKFMLTS